MGDRPPQIIVYQEKQYYEQNSNEVIEAIINNNRQSRKNQIIEYVTNMNQFDKEESNFSEEIEIQEKSKMDVEENLSKESDQAIYEEQYSICNNNSQEIPQVVEQNKKKVYQIEITQDYQKRRSTTFKVIIIESTQYDYVLRWVIEIPINVYKAFYENSDETIRRKLKDDIEKLIFIDPYNTYFSAHSLFQFVLKGLDYEKIFHLIEKAKDAYLSNIKNNSNEIEILIKKLIPKEAKLFSKWEYTIDDFLNQYQKRYQKTQELNEKEINFYYKENQFPKFKAKWIKLYPDRFLAELLQGIFRNFQDYKKYEALRDKLDPMIRKLNIKFNTSLQACLSKEILQKKDQEVWISEKFKISNVKVTKSMLQQEFQSMKLTLDESNSMKDFFIKAYKKYHEQFLSKNPSFEQQIKKVDIDLDEQFQSLINFKKKEIQIE